MKLCILHKTEAMHSLAAPPGEVCRVCWLERVKGAASALVANLEGIDDVVASIGPEFVEDVATLRQALKGRP